MAFTKYNTIGYTDSQLAALNAELASRVAGLEVGSDEFDQAEKAFSDEVSRREVEIIKALKINESGLEYIKTMLGQFHKFGDDHFTDSMIAELASDIETNWVDGNSVFFEIREADSKTGNPEIVDLMPNHYEILDFAG